MTITMGGAVLSEDQAAGRTCCICPLTFGRLDPVQALAGVEGVCSWLLTRPVSGHP